MPHDPDAETTLSVRFADRSVATSVGEALRAGKRAPTVAERTIAQANLTTRRDPNIPALRNLGATVANRVVDALSAAPPATRTGEKIAMIDTGIDYMHADFGGTSASTLPTAKVIGGIDLVGDTYNVSSATAADRVPHPDNDPSDLAWLRAARRARSSSRCSLAT